MYRSVPRVEMPIDLNSRPSLAKEFLRTLVTLGLILD
jgi:hypothetical protein